MSNQPKGMIGEVVSAKGEKTVIVAVVHLVQYPPYRKKIRKTKRFAVHNELPTIAVGDTVRIVSTKPISKTKHFIVKEKIV